MEEIKWSFFATPEEFAEAQRAAGALNQHLANAEREILTLKVFAMAVNQRMVESERRAGDAERRLRGYEISADIADEQIKTITARVRETLNKIKEQAEFMKSYANEGDKVICGIGHITKAVAVAFSALPSAPLTKDLPESGQVGKPNGAKCNCGAYAGTGA